MVWQNGVNVSSSPNVKDQGFQLLDRIDIKKLFECGVHFGHRTKRWNPKMAKYIFGKKQGIHIIDLNQTVECLRQACAVIIKNMEKGKGILFVGTKKQAKDVIEEEAKRCGAAFVTERWLGGLLTNFQTISQRIARLKEIERMKEDGRINQLFPKEIISLEKEYNKLIKVFRGIKDMDSLPGVVYIVDVNKEINAVREAHRLEIPTIAITDSNVDPDLVDYPIPANDDSLRSIEIITKVIADAVLEGRKGFEEPPEEIGIEKESPHGS